MRFAGDDSYTGTYSPKALVQSRAYLPQPVTPSTAYRNYYFTTYGYLAPYHSGYTRLYFYLYYSGSYRYYTYVDAPNAAYSSYTRYARTYRLPYAGYWFVAAYHADSNHAATWSPIRYFYVR